MQKTTPSVWTTLERSLIEWHDLSQTVRYSLFVSNYTLDTLTVSRDKRHVRLVGRYCLRMRKFFQFKPIETKFDNYKFRSRLEARWAVFFKTLGIDYRYEHEGYSLDGTPYLPDFWLPQQDCFVEIKGEKPTVEELRKAKLLSLYTMKRVYIFHGNIRPPDEGFRSPDSIMADGFFRPRLYHHCLSCEFSNCDHNYEIEVPVHIRAILQKLYDGGLYLRWHYGFFQIRRTQEQWGYEESLSENIEEIQRHYTEGLNTLPLLIQYEQELVQYLSHEDTALIEYDPQGCVEDHFWCECPQCGAFDICMGGAARWIYCKCTPRDQQYFCTARSPHLLAAFEAARQARFS